MCKTKRPGAVKTPKTDPEGSQKAKSNIETNFTSLPFRTSFFLFLSCFVFIFLIIFIFFYFSYFHSLFFGFVSLIALFDWFSLLSPSYCILIFHLSLHLYSNNTLILIFYFLFFLFRLYISNHIIVIPNPTQHPTLLLIHFTIPELYYCYG